MLVSSGFAGRERESGGLRRDLRRTEVVVGDDVVEEEGFWDGGRMGGEKE